MNYTIIVHAPGHATDASRTALSFCHAALDAGHSIVRVFFYHDGVENALASRVPPQGELDVTAAWRSFHHSTGVELAVCIAAALRRGVLNDEDAERYERPASTVDPAFAVVGLGQLIDAAARSERTITFAAPQ